MCNIGGGVKMVCTTPPCSDKLRKALGMTGDEYPPYISRMRDLGYPPGYQLLQTAESLVLYGEEASGMHGLCGLVAQS